VEDCRICSSNW